MELSIFLLGNKVTVFTDHQVSAFLTHLNSQTKVLLACWGLRLSRLLPKIELQFKPGITNGTVDALSRSLVKVPNVCLVNVTVQIRKQDEVLVRVQNEQRKDEDLKEPLQD